MKSLKKSILAVGLAVAVITAIGGANVFAAPQTQSAIVAGYGVYCRSDIKYGSATAYTEYGSYATVSVESRYNYCKTSYGEGGHKNNGTGSNKRAALSFSAPSGCKSVSISSTHRLTAGGQNWSTSTFDDKEA